MKLQFERRTKRFGERRRRVTVTTAVGDRSGRAFCCLGTSSVIQEVIYEPTGCVSRVSSVR